MKVVALRLVLVTAVIDVFVVTSDLNSELRLRDHPPMMCWRG